MGETMPAGLLKIFLCFYDLDLQEPPCITLTLDLKPSLVSSVHHSKPDQALRMSLHTLRATSWLA